MAYHWAIEWREREREREADEEETGGIAQNGCDVWVFVYCTGFVYRI